MFRRNGRDQDLKEDTGAGHPEQHLQLPDRGHCQVNREDIDIGIRISYIFYFFRGGGWVFFWLNLSV